MYGKKIGTLCIYIYNRNIFTSKLPVHWQLGAIYIEIFRERIQSC